MAHEGGSTSTATGSDLDDLRAMVIQLQRDVSRQEGDLLDMKRQIESCLRKEEADRLLIAMSKPDDVRDNIQKAQQELILAIESKATKQELKSALTKKASTMDIAQLLGEVDRLNVFVRGHCEIDSTMKLTGPLLSPSATTGDTEQAANATSTELTQLDLLSERLVIIEQALDDFHSSKGQYSGNKSGPDLAKTTSHRLRQLNDISSEMASLKQLCHELDDKYNNLSELAGTISTRIESSSAALNSNMKAIEGMEKRRQAGRDDADQVYNEIHPMIQDMAQQVMAAVQYMEKEMCNQAMLEWNHIDDDIEGFRADLSGMHTDVANHVDIIKNNLSRLHIAEASYNDRIAQWQNEVLASISTVKKAAKANQLELDTLKQPVINDVLALKAENHLFFKELIRVQAEFVHLSEDIEKRKKANTTVGQRPSNIPWSDKSSKVKNVPKRW